MRWPFVLFFILKMEGGLHTHDQHFDADGC